LGFSVIPLLNANKKEMEDAIDTFVEQLRQSKGVGLFYFSGHGAQADDTNYLYPADVELSDAIKEMKMVAVPRGEFFMGCNKEIDRECDNDEKPGQVSVGAFQIDKTEVTVAQYGQCVDAGECSGEGLTVPYWGDKNQPKWAWACNWGKAGRENHPINCVNWQQAQNYCQSVGKRLPTEAEWEKAARGTDGRKYPWGNRGYEAAGLVANIVDQATKRSYPNWTVAEGYDDGYVGTAPVGSFPAGASPYGALDMVGNVFEWTGTGSGAERYIVRGGSWYALPRFARASDRLGDNPGDRNESLGFRCAR
jgi:formylglycine-generating enzyme required for sulfatase activity